MKKQARITKIARQMYPSLLTQMPRLICGSRQDIKSGPWSLEEGTGRQRPALQPLRLVTGVVGLGRCTSNHLSLSARTHSNLVQS